VRLAILICALQLQKVHDIGCLTLTLPPRRGRSLGSAAFVYPNLFSNGEKVIARSDEFYGASIFSSCDQ